MVDAENGGACAAEEHRLLQVVKSPTSPVLSGCSAATVLKSSVKLDSFFHPFCSNAICGAANGDTRCLFSPTFDRHR